MRRLERLSASAVLDPRGVAGVIPVRGAGARPWELYRKVSELQAGIDWLANVISRAELRVFERTENGRKRVDDPRLDSILEDLFDTGPSQSDMLKRIVKQLEISGESYLVPLPGRTKPEWRVASVREIRSTSDTIDVQIDNNRWASVDAKQVIRQWYPDDEFAWIAHSPVLAMEPILLEIIARNARTIAINESRLAGNGVLPLSDKLSVAMPSSEGDPNPVRTRDVYTAFEEAMVTPMTDRGLVSSVVPILLIGPKEELPNKDSIINMSSPLDEKSVEQLEQALRRMAISMAIPPDIVLGLGDTNHWNSFAIIREAIQSAVEPRLDTITSGITEAYYRPRLKGLVDDPGRFFVGADVSNIVVPPDRSEAAAKARSQGLLTNEAWARYLGFEDSDIPTGSERKRIILEQVLLADPASAPWILPQLGITVPGFTTGQPAAEPRSTTPPTRSPALEPNNDSSDSSEPGQQPPEAPPGLAASSSIEETVVTAVEAAVLRVLERANNRLLRAHGREHRERLKDVETIDLHTHLPVTLDLKDHMLKGAYATWEKNMPKLGQLVATYVDYLYDNQLPHSRELLTETLMGTAEHWPREGEPVG